jgi:hypothetical protein
MRSLSLLLAAACELEGPQALPGPTPPPSPAVLWELPLNHDALLDRGVAVAPDGALLVPGEDGTGQAAVVRLTVDPRTGLVEQAPFTEGLAYNAASLSEGDLNQDGVDDLLVVGVLYGDVVLRVYDRTTGALMLRRTLQDSPYRVELLQADLDPMWEMLAVGGSRAVVRDDDGRLLHEVDWPYSMWHNVVDLNADGVPEVVSSDGEILDGATLSVTRLLPVQRIGEVWPVDADEDGNMDLLVSDVVNRTTWTLIDGPTLVARWTRTAGINAPAHFDMNGDGQKDIAFIDGTPGAPVLWIDPVTGGVGGRLTTPDLSWVPDALFVWDHDGDGAPELLAGGGDYESRFGTRGAGTVTRLWDPASGWHARPPLLHASYNLVTGDVDGDGWREVVTGGDFGVATYIGMIDGRTGDLLYHWPAPALPAGSPRALLMADVDGDGNDELVTLNEQEETVVYDLNRQRLGPPRVLGNLGTELAAVRDASGVDAVVGHGFRLPITWWGGGRTWTYNLPPTTLSDVAAADWDGDGVEEVLAVDGQHLYVLDQQSGSLLHREMWGFWSGIGVYESGGHTDLLLWGETEVDRYELVTSQPPRLVPVVSLPKDPALAVHGFAVVGDSLLVPAPSVSWPQAAVHTGDLLWWNLQNRRMGRQVLSDSDASPVKMSAIRPQPVEGGFVIKTQDRRMIAYSMP